MSERESLACSPVKMFCFILSFDVHTDLSFHPLSCPLVFWLVSSCLVLTVTLWHCGKAKSSAKRTSAPYGTFKHWQIDCNVCLRAFASYYPKECRLPSQVTHVTECPHLTHRRCSCVISGNVKVWQTFPCWHPRWQMVEFVFYMLIIQNGLLLFCLLSAF